MLALVELSCVRSRQNKFRVTFEFGVVEVADHTQVSRSNFIRICSDKQSSPLFFVWDCLPFLHLVGVAVALAPFCWFDVWRRW